MLAGLAAGFDKDAEAIEGLMGVGFGFVEVGESDMRFRCVHIPDLQNSTEHRACVTQQDSHPRYREAKVQM